MAGVVFYFRDALEDLPDAAARIKEIRITGGGARSKVWRQLTADILQRPVVKTACPECGAMGCAVSAAVASGHYRDFDEAIAAMVAMDTACEPQDTKRADNWFVRYKERRQKLLG
jgi:xylulokinase